jgi:hypothetical protein
MAPSLTRGRVSNLLLLLGLASAFPPESALSDERSGSVFCVFCKYQSIVSKYIYIRFT